MTGTPLNSEHIDRLVERSHDRTLSSGSRARARVEIRDAFADLLGRVDALEGTLAHGEYRDDWLEQQLRGCIEYAGQLEGVAAVALASDLRDALAALESRGACKPVRLTSMTTQAPLREVIETVSCDDVTRVERLSCGHTKTTLTASDRPAHRRRCLKCLQALRAASPRGEKALSEQAPGTVSGGASSSPDGAPPGLAADIAEAEAGELIPRAKLDADFRGA